jgi:hypothetical protein
MIGALTLGGLTAMMTVEGGTDSEVFNTYLRDVLNPELQPGDIVVLDHLGAHKTIEARQIGEASGCSSVVHAALFP